MLLSKKGYYYTKVLLFFTFSKKRSFSIKEISERLEISVKVLEQVLLFLKNKKILQSKRGPNGGYTLAADVLEISIADINEMSGKRFEIISFGNGETNKLIDKVIGDAGSSIQKTLFDAMSKVRIRDLVNDMNQKVTENGLNYVI